MSKLCLLKMITKCDLTSYAKKYLCLMSKIVSLNMPCHLVVQEFEEGGINRS